MFKLLDRYLVREIVLPMLLALVVFTFVLEIPPIIQQAETLISKGVPWSIVGRVLLTLLPQALSLTIPISVLMGILMGCARLSADREFVAMQACGVSLMRLARPVVLVAGLGMLATGYAVIVALPDANQTFREITFSLLRQQVETKIKPQVFFHEIPNRVIYVRDLPPGGGWRDVFLADTTRPDHTTVFFAREGRILVDRERRQVHIQLIDATSHTTTRTDPEWYENQRFERTTISLDPKTIFPEPPSRGVPEMSFAELRAAIAQGGDQAIQPRFMRSYKFALPTTCLILGLIGLALGTSNRKDARFTSFAVGIGVILVYYVLLYGARSFANGGRLNPAWAPWIPNILMTTAGAVLLMWRAQWAERGRRFSIPAFWQRSPRSSEPASGSASGRPRARLVLRVPYLNLPAPRLLDLYIGRQYLRVFALGVASLLAIFYISTFIDLVDKLFRGDTTTRMLLQFFYYQTPQFVYFIIPMAVLISALVTVGVLTKNNELMVMRACGISLYRTAAPLILFALGASVVLYGVQERVLAHTRREADRLERIIRRWPALSSPLDRRWAFGADGHVYHYDFLNADGNRFSQLHIYRLDEPSWTLRGVTYARDATPVSSAESEDSHTLIAWTLRQGWERELSESSRSGGHGGAVAVKYSPFTEREQRLESPDYFKGTNPDPDMMTYAELGDFVARLEASGADSGAYRVALRRKIAFPLVTVIMTMLAIPFAAATGRRGALYGIGAAIAIGIIYYISQSIFGAIGAGGLLPPLLAAWAPNLMFGAVALYLILTVRT